MRAFGTKAYKVREYSFICFTRNLPECLKGFFGIPPAIHGDDLPYYFPNGAQPAFANADFQAAFSGTFLNFAISLDPSVKWNILDITPPFPKWSGSVEMLFNKTETNTPDLRTTTTSEALLKRCE